MSALPSAYGKMEMDFVFGYCVFSRADKIVVGIRFAAAANNSRNTRNMDREMCKNAAISLKFRIK